jgi:hypothetical protein
MESVRQQFSDDEPRSLANRGPIHAKLQTLNPSPKFLRKESVRDSTTVIQLP